MTTAPEAGRATQFGRLLRDHRLACGLTQEELAERAELSVRGLRYVEQGLRRPNRDTVQRLIVALALGPAHGEELHTAARPGHVAAPRAPGAAVLPVPGGPLIGREREVGMVSDLLLRPDVRVVTLTGPGGVDKTRLAIEVAARLAGSVDGVVWVPLGTVTDPDLVLAAIAAAAGLTDAGVASLPQTLVSALHDRPVLLLLDNFEQVVAAAAAVADLALRCPRLRVLVTSRVGLRLRNAHDVVVAPLATPGAEEPASVQALAANPAVDLFLRRAQAAQAGFALRQPDAAAVAAICRRLEGIPLALELAAARVPVLPPAALLARLDHRLTLLRDDAVDVPERQRTMRATIAWSHDQLGPAAQRLFRRLAPFEGGFSLEAVDVVHGSAGEPGIEVLDTLEVLEQHSLLQLVPSATGEPRYRMFETIREFAVEQLAAAGEQEAQRRNHARYFLALAEEAARAAFSPEAASWLDRLDDDHDNLRAVLRGCLARSDAETALRLAGALWSFWYVRGYAGEGRTHLAAVLALPSDESMRCARAHVLLGAGQIATTQADYFVARTWLAESITLYRDLGDPRGLAEALLAAGFTARVQEDGDHALRMLREALTTARACGHTFIEAASLHHLGLIAADLDGNQSAARRLLEESLALYRRLDLPRFVSLLLLALGDTALARGDLPLAHDLLRDSGTLLRRTGERLGIHGILDSFAQLAMTDGQVERAVCLAGAADRLRRGQGTRSWPVLARRRERWLARARTELGAATLDVIWQRGGAMSAEHAIALALEE